MNALILLALVASSADPAVPTPSAPPLPPPESSPSKGWFLSGKEVSAFALKRLEKGTCGDKTAVTLTSTRPTVGNVTMMQVVDAAQYVGKRLRFAATVRTDKVTGWSGLWMRVDGADKQHSLAFDNMQNRPLTGTLPCARQAVVLDVPSGAKQVALGLLLEGEGTTEMTDVDIAVVDTSVPTTNQAPMMSSADVQARGRVGMYWFNDTLLRPGYISSTELHLVSPGHWSDKAGDYVATLRGDEVDVKFFRFTGTFKVHAEAGVTTMTGTWGVTSHDPVQVTLSHQQVDMKWGMYERHLKRDDSLQVSPACAQYTDRMNQYVTPSDRFELCGEALEPGVATVQQVVGVLLSGFHRTPDYASISHGSRASWAYPEKPQPTPQ
jgi:hypothetical protein